MQKIIHQWTALTIICSAIFFSTPQLYAQNKDEDGFITIESTEEFDDGFDTPSGDEFGEAGDEFKSVSSDEFKSVSDDEFKTVSDSEFKSVSDDEFAPLGDDEFAPIESSSSSSSSCCATNKSCTTAQSNTALQFVMQILLITILAGILVRFKTTRNLRIVFLLGSLIYLGFIKGACPCPISSVQYSVLFAFGEDVAFHKILYFLGLIPITYVLGKVWCGWVCHMGAVQEFLHLPAKYNFLKGRKAQNVLRIMRWVLFATLVVQLFIGREIFYCKIDPFLSIFNLGLSHSYPVINGILLGIILLSSLFVYRPFCRSMCPIGLLLGLVSKIPGASVIGVTEECISCAVCNNNCKIEAITREGKKSYLDNQDCIACGDCISACKKNSLSLYRKSKKHPSQFVCETKCNS